MTVKQQPLNAPQQQRKAGLGQVSPAAVETWFIRALHLAAWMLIALSIVGTFYGARNLDAPLLAPWRIVADVIAAPGIAALALLAQVVLALVQWGARQMADGDPRWWLAYLGSLALSAWWNWSAYGDPLIAFGVPWAVALGIVVLGDVAPELLLVRRKG